MPSKIFFTALHLVNDCMVQTERHFCNLLSGLLQVFVLTLAAMISTNGGKEMDEGLATLKQVRYEQEK